MSCLADASLSLQAAVASLAASLDSPGRPYYGVQKALRHLRLVLEPAPAPVRVQSSVVSAARANGYRPRPKKTTPPVSRVRLVKPQQDDDEDYDEAERTLDRSSSWDPAPIDEQLEASRCRAFLLEIVRRAIHDWVLYRQHSKLELKEVAADAFTWLFEEEPGHPWWQLRIREKRTFTALISICDVLDLDVETVRGRARSMDVRTILAAGRPPEVRRRRAHEESDYQEHGVTNSIDISGAGDDPGSSFYENYFATPTTSSVL